MTQATALYNTAYEAGYRAAVKELKAKRAQTPIKEYRPEQKPVFRFFNKSLLKQKLAGAALFAASFAGLMIMHGDFAVALFTAPVGFALFVTPNKLIR